MERKQILLNLIEKSKKVSRGTKENIKLNLLLLIQMEWKEEECEIKKSKQDGPIQGIHT